MKNTFLILLACWFCTIPNTVLAQQLSQLLIDGAMKECHTGRIAQDRATRVAHFKKGEALGEQAVASDDQSAEAHFALFCNLGELMRIHGELSITSVRGFRRMTKELDRTLELAPDHLDALSAKGTFLVRLPSMLGGDREKGEKLLRYVLLKNHSPLMPGSAWPKVIAPTVATVRPSRSPPKRWISPKPNGRMTSCSKRKQCWLSSGPTPPRQISPFLPL